MNTLSITEFSSHAFTSYIQSQPLYYGYCDTSIGKLIMFATHHGMYKASFASNVPKQELRTYTLVSHLDTTKIILIGTPFQCKVWQATLAIPAGSTLSYQKLATAIGHPQSYRAVANALAQNNIPYIIPCHRVLRTDGSLGGYAWGMDKKEILLKDEGIYLPTR